MELLSSFGAELIVVRLHEAEGILGSGAEKHHAAGYLAAEINNSLIAVTFSNDSDMPQRMS